MARAPTTGAPENVSNARAGAAVSGEFRVCWGMSPTPSRALVVFARVPALGQVKTRLAASIGQDAALAAYRELGAHTIATTAGLRECARIVAFTPADGAPAMREWLGDDLRYEAQEGDDLGSRLWAAVHRRFAEGASQVAVIGTDCPTLTADDVERAFAALDRADVVLGPAEDGGYWLIALDAAHEAPFREIPWSSADTLRETLRRLQEAGLRAALLDRKADVDTVVEWRAWKGG